VRALSQSPKESALRLGAAMAEVLVKRIAGEAVDRVTILPAELVIRAST
jgi:DNA-binding LacI/PurR family transcriptional regulator